MMADTDEKINEYIKKSLFICYRSTHRQQLGNLSEHAPDKPA